MRSKWMGALHNLGSEQIEHYSSYDTLTATTQKIQAQQKTIISVSIKPTPSYNFELK
ncbi:MAG: hypothetical protein KBB94_08430 [Legionellaceae bacterium]|nr:hypothetical protein [Legionellaceae bacterium]MBP9775402.1 hypothetical protein [Legionellaceae bacterium]